MLSKDFTGLKIVPKFSNIIASCTHEAVHYYYCGVIIAANLDFCLNGAFSRIFETPLGTRTSPQRGFEGC